MPGGDDQYDLEMANEAEQHTQDFAYLYDTIYEATRTYLYGHGPTEGPTRQGQPSNFPQTFQAFWNQMRKDNGMS